MKRQTQKRGEGEMGKKGLKKRKKLIALLSVAAAVLSLAGGGIGAAFAMAAAKSSASSSPSSSYPSSAFQNAKAREKEVQQAKAKIKKKDFEEAKAKEERARRPRPALLVSSTSGTTSSSDADVIGGGVWSGGEVSSSTAAFSSSPSSSIPSSNSLSLSLSSALYWLPFYFAGAPYSGSVLPTTPSGSLDVAQVKSWIESGNFASGAYAGLQEASGSIAEKPYPYLVPSNEGMTYQSPLFGGVNPDTGAPLKGGITTAQLGYFSSGSTGEQTFEAFAVSSCIKNSSIQGAGSADALLGVSSPTPSSCLAAFQKNAEWEAEAGGSSYDLLTYSGLERLLGVLDYSLPSNQANDYQGPGLEGPVKVTVGLSASLMRLFASYPDGTNLRQYGSPIQPYISGSDSALKDAHFYYQLATYFPNSSQPSYVSGQGIEWVFKPSLYSAHFKAVSEDGKPLKQIYLEINDMSYDLANLAPGYWDPDDLSVSALWNYYQSGSPLDVSSSPYKYFGWVNNSLTLSGIDEGFSLSCVPGDPGDFTLPDLPAGSYSLAIFSAVVGDLTPTPISEGSAYAFSPSFTLTLGSSGQQTIASQDTPSFPQGDVDGFINASTQTVVLGAHNPFAEVLNSAGEAEENPVIPAETGKEHTFTYQLQSYLPYSAPFSLTLSPSSPYSLDLAGAQIAGIPLSELESRGLSLEGDKITLNASAIAYIEQNGFMPATFTSPTKTTKLLSPSGWGARVFSIEIPTYLTSIPQAGQTVSYSLSYSNSVSGQGGQTLTGNFENEDSSNPWFKAVSEEGKPLSRLTVEYVNAYLDLSSEDFGTDQTAKTLTLSSAPFDPSLFVIPPALVPTQQTAEVYVPEGSSYPSGMDCPYNPVSTILSGPNGANYLQIFSLGPATLGQAGSMMAFSNNAGVPGFVDTSTRTVVTGVPNPSSQLLSSSGTVDSSPYPTFTVGQQDPFTYQVQTFFSANPSYDGFMLSASQTYLSSPYTQYIVVDEPAGMDILQSADDVTVAGLPLSQLEPQGVGVLFNVESANYDGQSFYPAGIGIPAGILISIPSSALSYIASHGYRPATVSSKEGSSPLDGDPTLSVTFKAYLTPSNSASQAPESQILYNSEAAGGAYPTSGAGNITSPQVYTNGPSDNSIPSSLTPAEDSSSTGLWFKSLNADGTASSGSKFLVQNSSGQYLIEDLSSGSFEGWSWSSSPQDATEFSQRNANALFSFGGLADGTYTLTQIAWPSSMGKGASQPGTGENNWPSISPSTSNKGPEWAGYPGSSTGAQGYEGSFKVDLSYSSPEAMSTAADPAGLVDTSEDQIYALSPIKMAPLIGSSLSSDAYQTETVGIPFEEGWEGYLPIANTAPSSAAGKNGYDSSLRVQIDEDVNGLEMDSPSASNIEVAGVSLSALLSNGALASSSGGVYSISLPYSALEYLEENGKNAEGEDLSSSQNRLIIVSFPALMETSFKNGGTFRQWMAMGFGNGGWWTQSSDWFVSSSPLYTNGPADNSVPSSLSPSQNSSSTGLWFKSLWKQKDGPATGARFTVKNSSGEYLTPVTNSSGTFTGWSYSKTPYDFEEQNSSAVFSFGGLANGTYTVSEVSAATGATFPSFLSFTSTIDYSSPQVLTPLLDPMDLFSPKKAVVYNVVIPSHLPLTGGKGVLFISLLSCLLFLSGLGGWYWVKRKRGSHSSRTKHGF